MFHWRDGWYFERLENGDVHVFHLVPGEGTPDTKLVIPAEVTGALRPFYGASAVLVKARLRFAVRSGDLQIGYFLHRTDEIRRAAFAEVVDVVHGELAGVPLLEAVAPSACTPAS